MSLHEDFEPLHVEIFRRGYDTTFSVRLTNEHSQSMGIGPIAFSAVSGPFSLVEYLTPEQAVELSKMLSRVAIAADEARQPS